MQVKPLPSHAEEVAYTPAPRGTGAPDAAAPGPPNRPPPAPPSAVSPSPPGFFPAAPAGVLVLPDAATSSVTSFRLMVVPTVSLLALVEETRTCPGSTAMMASLPAPPPARCALLEAETRPPRPSASMKAYAAPSGTTADDVVCPTLTAWPRMPPSPSRSLRRSNDRSTPKENALTRRKAASGEEDASVDRRG